MANVKTYTLDIFFYNNELCFSNLSRTAVDYYVDYYRDRLDFISFHWEEKR